MQTWGTTNWIQHYCPVWLQREHVHIAHSLENSSGRCSRAVIMLANFAIGCHHVVKALCYFYLCYLPTSDQWKNMSKALTGAGHSLVAVQDNLIDAIWTDRPERPSTQLRTLGQEYTGQCKTGLTSLLHTRVFYSCQTIYFIVGRNISLNLDYF